MSILHILENGEWKYTDCELIDGQWYSKETNELIDRASIWWVE